MSALPSAELLERAFLATLEDAAFLFGEVGGSGVEDDVAVVARLELRAAQRYTLAIAATQAFSEVLASNLLGLEPGSPEVAAAAEDALGELLNISSGVLADGWLTSGRAYDLGTPTIEHGTAAALRGRAALTARLLVDDEHPMDIFLVDEGEGA